MEENLDRLLSSLFFAKHSNFDCQMKIDTDLLTVELLADDDREKIEIQIWSRWDYETVQLLKYLWPPKLDVLWVTWLMSKEAFMRDIWANFRGWSLN